jgi:hypothetical protein
MKDHGGDQREKRENGWSPCGGFSMSTMEREESSRMNETRKECEKVFFGEKRKRI